MHPLVLWLAGVSASAVALNYLAPRTAAGLAVALERRRVGLRQKRLRIPGFDIAYLEGGKGEPLVLLHGIGADKDHFTRVAAHLTQHFQIIALDLPGFGDSSRQPAAQYGIREQTERVHAIVRTLGLQRFLLGGSSMGGHIASCYARTYPDDVSALWLLAPAGATSVEPTEVHETYRRSGRALLFAETVEDFPNVLELVFSKAPWLPSSLHHVQAERSVRDCALHTRILGEIMEGPPLEELLEGLQTPALVVWGSEDRVLNPSAGATLHGLLPRSELVVLPGIGHLPMLEVPRECARGLVRFWRRVLRAAL